MRKLMMYEEVDEMSWKVAKDQLPPDLVSEYKEAFQMLDRKNTGKISIRDIATVACSIGMQLSDNQLLHYVGRVLEFDEINFTEECVEFPEFLTIMISIITECVSEDEVIRIFNVFDKDGDGFISANELRELLSQLGDNVTEDDIQDMMREADTDGDGLVSLYEFIHVMSTPTNQATPCCSASTATSSTSDNSNSIMDIETSSVDYVRSWSNSTTQDRLTTCHSDSDSDCLSDTYDVLGVRRRKSHSSKRRRSLADWFRRRRRCDDSDEEESMNTPTTSTSRSTKSLFSSRDFCSTSHRYVGRRRSSIGKTLRHSCDALLATARSFRKMSR